MLNFYMEIFQMTALDFFSISARPLAICSINIDVSFVNINGTHLMECLRLCTHDTLSLPWDPHSKIKSRAEAKRNVNNDIVHKIPQLKFVINLNV